MNNKCENCNLITDFVVSYGNEFYCGFCLVKTLENYEKQYSETLEYSKLIIQNNQELNKQVAELSEQLVVAQNQVSDSEEKKKKCLTCWRSLRKYCNFCRARKLHSLNQSDRNIAIVEMSKTMRTQEIADIYGVTYQTIHHVIRQAEKYKNLKGVVKLKRKKQAK